MTSTPQQARATATQPWFRRHFRLTLVLGLVAVVLLLLVVPPFISVRRYKKHITELVSASLGRPVRLSSAELRLLPRPGFVLRDLTVEEDPAYGAEPVLHADTVVTYIRLWPLWRGRLVLDKISVDEASLNLVRAASGRWNVDSLLHTAEPDSGTDSKSSAGRPPLPYLEATNSRINIKAGAEKLPYSLTNTDASLWQDDGAWHVRLRGQPVRTDVNLNAADTGIVRLEATFHPASKLNHMPLHLDLDWREAQLGQLSRLLLGSDEDWRGDLTGELHLDGTAEAAKITGRLRASGVHRAEFAPAAQLDFDATCSFLYHYSQRAAENIECNSPVGSGKARLTGAFSPEAPHLTLELSKVPAQAPLDLLRTLRGNLDQSLSAQGTFSGKMSYAPVAAASVAAVPALAKKGRRAGKTTPVPNPLEGKFTAGNVKISGEGLSNSIEVSKITLEPAPMEPNQPPALAAVFSIPAGGPGPLTVTARFARPGFDLSIRGSAALARLRELAHTAGIVQAEALGQLSGEPATLDLHLEGPWFAESSEQLAASDLPDDSAKKVTGTIAFHNAVWKPDFLASPVEIAVATLHMEEGRLRWEPVAFTYGPAGTAVRGTASMTRPAVCDEDAPCTPHFTLHFATLNAAELQSALLGAREKGTLLTTLLDRFRSNSTPDWPVMQGKVEADAFTVGPFVLNGASADVRVESHGAKITAFVTRALGGQVHGTGSLTAPVRDGKPVYTLDASFAGINPREAGRLVGQKWSGGPLSGSGTLRLSGFTGAELAAGAKGSLSFDWRNGAVAQVATAPALAHFSRWSGMAKVEKSALTLGDNKVRHGAKPVSASGELTFGREPKFALTTPRR